MATLGVSDALSESIDPVIISGKQWFLRELDLNDLVDLERMGVDLETVTGGDMEVSRKILWLVLRKSDPEISEEDRESGNYRIQSERDAGKIITLRVLKENPDIIQQILARSGFASEEPEGNEAAGEVK